MPRVEYSDSAVEQLVELARDKGADDQVLDELARHLETVAEYPQMAEPAKYPIGRGHMSVIHLFDGTGVMWGFTVALWLNPDGITVRAINGGRAPLHFDD